MYMLGCNKNGNMAAPHIFHSQMTIEICTNLLVKMRTVNSQHRPYMEALCKSIAIFHLRMICAVLHLFHCHRMNLTLLLFFHCHLRMKKCKFYSHLPMIFCQFSLEWCCVSSSFFILENSKQCIQVHVQPCT